MAREAEARTKRLGVWGVSATASWMRRMWSVWVASRADTSSSRVAAAGEGSGRAYLNFAKDWHGDFTVLLERKDSEALKSPGIEDAGRQAAQGAGLGRVAEWPHDPSHSP